MRGTGFICLKKDAILKNNEAYLDQFCTGTVLWSKPVMSQVTVGLDFHTWRVIYYYIIYSVVPHPLTGKRVWRMLFTVLGLCTLLLKFEESNQIHSRHMTLENVLFQKPATSERQHKIKLTPIN